jgi:hypothetical protein
MECPQLFEIWKHLNETEKSVWNNLK